MACFLFWKVDQVMDRSSGKAGLRPGPASASVVGEMVGTVSGAGDAPHPAPPHLSGFCILLSAVPRDGEAIRIEWERQI